MAPLEVAGTASDFSINVPCLQLLIPLMGGVYPISNDAEQSKPAYPAEAADPSAVVRVLPARDASVWDLSVRIPKQSE